MTKEVQVCVNCGADDVHGAPLSGCTENRGRGAGQAHHYVRPSSRPLGALTYDELRMRLGYYAMKATGSVATFQAFARAKDDASLFTCALYREKATKRVRLCALYVEELETRLKEASAPLDMEIDALITEALDKLEHGLAIGPKKGAHT